MDVKILKEAGYEEALLGLSLNKNQPTEKMPKVAEKLATKDGGHNKFLESIQVWIDIRATRKWWQDFDTYRVGMTKQSESTNHTITKRYLTKNDFAGNVWQDTIDELNTLIGKYDMTGDIIYFDELKDNLPEGFLQRRVVSTNYKCLRNIYKQRKNHKLAEFRQFCRYMRNNLEFGHWLD